MYTFLSQLAQTFGLVLFVIAFVLVLIYALAPSNRHAFERASQLPLDESDGDNEHE
ncbi:MAG: cbb3-type cytochrome c oxidase subunit 3 [Pseudomonadota bacterium]